MSQLQVPHIPLFPLQLRLTGRLVVVVGGGPVGQRKARSVLAAGARVRVVAREAPPGDFPTESVEWRQEAYRPEHLMGASLILAAATESVNRQIVADARRLGVWVNSASEPEQGDVVLPAVRRVGPVTVTVSTEGGLPAASRTLCQQLSDQIDDPIRNWFEFLIATRMRILTIESIAPTRRELLLELSDRRWLDRLRQVGWPVVEAELQQIVASATGAPISAIIPNQE